MFLMREIRTTINRIYTNTREIDFFFFSFNNILLIHQEKSLLPVGGLVYADYNEKSGHHLPLSVLKTHTSDARLNSYNPSKIQFKQKGICIENDNYSCTTHTIKITKDPLCYT